MVDYRRGVVITVEEFRGQIRLRKLFVCPLPIVVNKFDDDILSRLHQSPCTKSDAVGDIFQVADIFELDKSIVIWVGSD